MVAKKTIDGAWSLDFGLWLLDCGFWIVAFGLGMGDGGGGYKNL